MRLPVYVGRHWPATTLILAFAIGDGGTSTLLPPLFREYGKDPATIGLLVAVPAVVALVMRIPGGLIYKPSRARWLMGGSAAICMAGMVLFPVTSDSLLLALIGALYGVGYSTLTTVNLAAVIEAIRPGEDRGGAIGFYVSGLSTGYAVSSSLWGAVADGFGFQAGFNGMAAATGIALLLVLFGKQPEQMPSPRPPALVASPWRRAQSFSALLLDPTVMFMMLGAFFINVFLAQFSTFLPLTLLALGLSLGQIGALRSFWSLTNTIGRIFGGPVLRRVNHHTAQHASLILQAGMLALFAFPMPFAAYIVVTVLAASGRAICYVANAVAMADIDPRKISRGVASGTMNAAGDLGKILGPATGGLIANAVGVQSFWLVAPPLYLAIYFGVLLLVRKPPPATSGP
jgi:predicted MFS family arabinose efflux permease